MNHRERILEFLFAADNGDDFTEWLYSLPPPELADALNEYRSVVSEINPDPDNPALQQRLADIGILANAQLEAYHSAEALRLKSEAARQEANQALSDFAEALETTKRNIREGIANNHPDRQAMIEYAKFLLDAEKQVGLYDPDDWAWFENRY